MKKILMFHNYNTCVGAGLCLLQIISALKDNYEIKVIIPNISGDLDIELKKMGIECIKVNKTVISYAYYSGNYNNIFNYKYLKNCINIKYAERNIKDIIKKENPDLVFTNSMTLYWIGKVAKKNKYKSICYVRETFIEKKIINYRTKKIIKEMNKYLDKVIFISEYDRKYAVSNSLDYSKTKVITDKVEYSIYKILDKNEMRRKLQLNQNDYIVLYVGGDSNIKGPMIALKAIKNSKVDCKLVFLQHKFVSKSKNIKEIIKRVIGKNVSYNVEKYIKKNNLNNRVILREKTNEVEKYFIASDVVIFPSTVVHQARPVYEAGFSKKPVIVTNFKNTSEFANESTAFLFPNGNYKDLAWKIDNIFIKYNSREIQEIVNNNFNKVKEKNNFETFNEELENVIGELL